MTRLRRLLRRIVDFSTMVAIPFLAVVGLGDVLGGNVEYGGIEIAIAFIAGLTAWNSRARVRDAARGRAAGVRRWEAVLAFVLFTFVGALSVANARRSDGAEATTNVVGAVFLFSLACVALWVLWRAHRRRELGLRS